MSAVKHTAALMLECLDASEGGPVLATDLHRYVEDNGGNLALLKPAAKWLRDIGVMIVANKARHQTTWSIATTDDEIATWSRRMLEDHYSEKRSQARALYFAKHSAIRAHRRVVVAEAVTMGAALGIRAEVVLRDCEATPTPPQRGALEA
jgi:hypothetical protein